MTQGTVDLTQISLSHQIPSFTGRIDAERLVKIFLSNKSERTIAAYKKDLTDFARFLGIQDGNLDHAARLFLSNGRGGANALAAEYRELMESRKLSPATINRRLSALRSMVEQAGTLGLVNWELKIKGPKSKQYRDTAGPGTRNIRRMFNIIQARRDAKGLRDFAILRLLYDLALRRGEVVSLDLDDVDLETGIVKILGKGRTEKEILTLPQPTIEALRSWLGVRGSDAGPLFTNFDRAGKGGRVTGTAVYQIVRKLGQELGIKTRPHGIRHSSISACVAQFHLTDVQRFSRHKKLETVAIYIDQLDGGVQSKIADFVSRTA
ncbi:MAG: tyrosine-type recombinase/integrase [Desulfomonilaceae bacterium]